MRAAALALLLFAVAACGKYGPPVRSATEPAPAAAPVSSAPEGADTEAIDQSAGGEDDESDIPEAKHPGEAEPLRASKEHD